MMTGLQIVKLALLQSRLLQAPCNVEYALSFGLERIAAGVEKVEFGKEGYIRSSSETHSVKMLPTPSSL
jgi:hypothetical protein